MTAGATVPALSSGRTVRAPTTPSGNAPKTGDACWAGQVLHVSFGSISGDLVNDPATPTGWRVSNDDGTRVDYVTGGVNGTFDGGYWRLTGRDGTQYFFGRNQLPGYGAEHTGDELGVDRAGLQQPDPAAVRRSCTMAWRWNLDYVVDTHHRRGGLLLHSGDQLLRRQRRDHWGVVCAGRLARPCQLRSDRSHPLQRTGTGTGPVHRR